MGDKSNMELRKIGANKGTGLLFGWCIMRLARAWYKWAPILLSLCACLPLGCAEFHPEVRSAESEVTCDHAKTEEELLSFRKREFAESEVILSELLNRLHQEYERNEPPLAVFLADAQRKWMEYRESECKVQTYYSATGAAHEVYRLSCLTKMNRERAAELRSLMANP
jgi:uncharacterized protein YecT (DUF1311 family)